MSIASEIERIKSAKEALKNAINAKGGTLTDESLDQYAAAISNLPIDGSGGGGGGSSVDKTPVYRVTHMNNGEEVGDYWDSGLLSTGGRPIYTNGVCYLGYDDNSSFTYIRTIAEFNGPYDTSNYLFRSKDSTRLSEGVHTGDYEPGSARDYPYAHVEKL